MPERKDAGVCFAMGSRSSWGGGSRDPVAQAADRPDPISTPQCPVLARDEINNAFDTQLHIHR